MPKAFVSISQQAFRTKAQPRFVVMVFIPMRHAGRIFVQITAELSGCCSETFKRNLSSRDSVFPAPASCMASCGDSANL